VNGPFWLLRTLLLRKFEYHSGVRSVRERSVSCEYLIRRSVARCEIKRESQLRWANLDDHHGKGIHVGLFCHPYSSRCGFWASVEYGQPFGGHPPNGSSAIHGRGMRRLRIGSYGCQSEIAQDCVLVVVDEDVGLYVQDE